MSPGFLCSGFFIRGSRSSLAATGYLLSKGRIGLTQALQLATGLKVTIYRDSKYAFLTAHSHMAIWKERGFLTTWGTTVVNGWIKAFPTCQETASIVAETLLKHIIPQFGLSASIQSVNGLAFISKVTQLVAETLNITWKLQYSLHLLVLGFFQQ